MTQESPDQTLVASDVKCNGLQSKDRMSIISGEDFYQTLVESLRVKLDAGSGETLYQIGSNGGKRFDCCQGHSFLTNLFLISLNLKLNKQMFV